MIMANAADGIIYSIQEHIYTFIDSLNFTRNGLNASTAIIDLAKISISNTAAAGLSATSGLLLTGCGTLYLALAKGIPTAIDARKKTETQYQNIIRKKTPSQDVPPSDTTTEKTSLLPKPASTENNMPAAALALIEKAPDKQKPYLKNILWMIGQIISCVIFIEVITGWKMSHLSEQFTIDNKLYKDDKQVQIAQKKIYLATLTEIYWSHMIRIGILQMAIGLCSILTSGPAAGLLHAGCIAAKTGFLIGQVLGSVLGVTYLLRGGALIYRSYQSRKLAQELRAEIASIYQDSKLTPKQKAQKIKEALETYCTVDGENIDFLKGLKLEHVNDDELKSLQNIDFLDLIKDQDALTAYVKVLDMGLHKELVKFEVGMSLGAAMILGGACTLIAAFASGGSSLAITTLITSVIFMVLEGTFALYDSSYYFDQYQKELYKTPGWLLESSSMEVSGRENASATPPNSSYMTMIANGAYTGWWYFSRVGTAVPRIMHYYYEQIDASIEQSKKQSSRQTES